jgi:hypothetical protein
MIARCTVLFCGGGLLVEDDELVCLLCGASRAADPDAERRKEERDKAAVASLKGTIADAWIERQQMPDERLRRSIISKATHAARPLEQRACVICNKSYMAKASQKHCSDSCRDKAKTRTYRVQEARRKEQRRLGVRR